MWIVVFMVIMWITLIDYAWLSLFVSDTCNKWIDAIKLVYVIHSLLQIY